MPGPGLDELTQASWSGGMCQAVARHLIPGDAAYDIRDGLLDDDGDVYQRGPSVRLTSNQLGTALSALWEAQFSVGRRMVGLSTTALGVVNAGAWVTLISSGVASLSGAGLAAQIGEAMFVCLSTGAANALMVYGGSLKTTGYSTGTVNYTAGSAIVQGIGTSWLANVDAGMVFRNNNNTMFGIVKSVDSNTQITLTAPWGGATVAGSLYGLNASTSNVNAQGAVAVAAVSGRLMYAEGRKVHMSNTIDQNTGASRPYVFDADDYHEFPADVVGMATLRDTVFVFTKAGIWSIGNAALPIVDAFGNPQHRVQRVSGDVVLRSPGGLTPWRDSLVVCAVGGVYVMDAAGGLELVSRSIGPLWQFHMDSGHLVWQAMTFRDHVFVPIGGEVLVARLDRRTNTPVGKSAPWTRFSQGESAVAAAFAVQDPYGTPKLVAGAPSISGYLLDLSGVFGSGALPVATGGLVDGNGAGVGMVVETREYVVDAGALATVRDVALEYESTDGTLVVSAAVGQRPSPTLPPLYTGLAASAAGNYATQNPRVIGVRREARRISFTIGSGGNVSGWRLRAVRLRSRMRGRRR